MNQKMFYIYKKKIEVLASQYLIVGWLSWHVRWTVIPLPGPAPYYRELILATFPNFIIHPGALATVSKPETALDIWRQEFYTAGLDERGSANIILAMWYWFAAFWTQTIPWLTENMYFNAQTQTVYCVLDTTSNMVYDNYKKVTRFIQWP